MAGMLCAIRQPNFLPRLSTLAKLYASDIWVILDDVQFTRRGYQHRCYLAPVADAYLPGRWLTLPVHLPGGRATMIRDARLAEPALTARRTSASSGSTACAVPFRCPGPDPRDRGSDHGHWTARRRQRARHDRPAPPPELAQRHLSQQRHPGLRRPFRTASRPHACRRGSHVPVRNGRQPLPRPGPLRRPGTLRRDVHPAAAPGRPSPEDTRRVSALADLAAAGPERLSAAIREHVRLSSGAWNSQQAGHLDPRMAEPAENRYRRSWQPTAAKLNTRSIRGRREVHATEPAADRYPGRVAEEALLPDAYLSGVSFGLAQVADRHLWCPVIMAWRGSLQSCAPAVGTDEGRLRDGRGGGSPDAQDDPAEVASGSHQVDGLGDLFEREVDVLRVQPACGEQVP